MAIRSSDIGWYGTSSLRLGPKLTSGVLNNIFPDLTGAQNRDLAVSHRAVAIVNNHATLTLTNARIWFRTVDPGGAGFAIALDSLGVVAKTAQIIETPSGLTFTSPTTSGTGLLVSSLAPGQAVGLWIRRVATASAKRKPERNVLTITGTTPA